ncbi:hypothetical protein B4U79_16714 [Dinothrombium tinctorium]|uniref:glucan endo-1,3-beta-D-glucosidase n=1 Tax=Dinothrombium tinctorium TaxID=1965070 RepID=A0A3S3PHP1_9ACAR|nr:hypothetical protein B4U79_16889 [Dinothrombium tinctorium]RWS01219.1 hypothetical protein B4U79_16760 [Dinothrombium tinctorium]RWS01584.1 hypothetical protein B4U79_16714 [Dinothrombium tinctorium]
MGTSFNNLHNNWDDANSICLITKAAAELNAVIGQKIFTVSQGIYERADHLLTRIEISRAFKAIEYANKKFPETVDSIIFTSENIFENTKNWNLYTVLQANIDYARQLNVSIGIRIHDCRQILNSHSPFLDIISAIIRSSDIVICNIHPAHNIVDVGIDFAVNAVINIYCALRDRLIMINPQLKTIIIETGLASQRLLPHDNPKSVSNLVYYWKKLGDWASNNQVPIHFFEAIDEPWRGELNHLEAHFGWWTREGDCFIEKVKNN